MLAYHHPCNLSITREAPRVGYMQHLDCCCSTPSHWLMHYRACSVLSTTNTRWEQHPNRPQAYDTENIQIQQLHSVPKKTPCCCLHCCCRCCVVLQPSLLPVTGWTPGAMPSSLNLAPPVLQHPRLQHSIRTAHDTMFEPLTGMQDVKGGQVWKSTPVTVTSSCHRLGPHKPQFPGAHIALQTPFTPSNDLSRPQPPSTHTSPCHKSLTALSATPMCPPSSADTSTPATGA